MRSFAYLTQRALASIADAVVSMESGFGDGVLVRVHHARWRGVTIQPSVRADKPVQTKPIVLGAYQLQQIQQSPDNGLGYAIIELKRRKVVSAPVSNAKDLSTTAPASNVGGGNWSVHRARNRVSGEHGLAMDERTAGPHFTRSPSGEHFLNLGIGHAVTLEDWTAAAYDRLDAEKDFNNAAFAHQHLWRLVAELFAREILEVKNCFRRVLSSFEKRVDNQQ